MSAKATTVYRCPNKCGDSRYPQPKWTTKAGYDAHMAKCPKSPARGRSVFALRWTNVAMPWKKRGSGYSISMEDCDPRDEITPYRTLGEVIDGWSQRA